jgi:hypothetical protein
MTASCVNHPGRASLLTITDLARQMDLLDNLDPLTALGDALNRSTATYVDMAAVFAETGRLSR